MRPLSAILMSTVAIALASASGGPAHPIPPTEQDCGDKTSQTEMNICFGERAEAADNELDMAYAELIGRLGDSEVVNLLKEAQQAWLTYRERHCAFVASATEGGSIQPTIISTCYTALAYERLANLRYQLTCIEGDMSCVTPKITP